MLNDIKSSNLDNVCAFRETEEAVVAKYEKTKLKSSQLLEMSMYFSKLKQLQIQPKQFLEVLRTRVNDQISDFVLIDESVKGHTGP